MTVLLFLTFGLKSQVNFSGLYLDSSEHFVFRLELLSNHYFKFEKVNRYGIDNNFNYMGTFKNNADTIELKINNSPYEIEYYQQIRIDSLQNKTLIYTCYSRNKPLQSSSPIKYYIDGQMVKSNKQDLNSTDTVDGIPIWINNDCNSIRFTDSNGNADFDATELESINTSYGTIYPKGKGNNCYILYLTTNTVLDKSPFLWNRLLIQDDLIIPLECNRPIDFIKLKLK